MPHDPSSRDMPFLQAAVRLAEEAGQRGNLPIGAVIALGDIIIARGRNSIWKPTLALTCHAEMEALRTVSPTLWSRSGEMTLFTTLEPCVMCAGAILLHHLGRLVFGSTDPWGGIGSCLGTLPKYFKDEFTLIEWSGPALPLECDPLY